MPLKSGRHCLKGRLFVPPFQHEWPSRQPDAAHTLSRVKPPASPVRREREDVNDVKARGPSTSGLQRSPRSEVHGERPPNSCASDKIPKMRLSFLGSSPEQEWPSDKEVTPWPRWGVAGFGSGGEAGLAFNANSKTISSPLARAEGPPQHHYSKIDVEGGRCLFRSSSAAFLSAKTGR